MTVSWSGSDAHSGVASYDIYVRGNGGGWAEWLKSTPDTSAVFEGEDGVTYDFYSIAQDNVGLYEDKAPLVEASTTVDADWGTANLGLALSGTTEVLLGNTVELTLNLSNAGPADAENISVQLTVPAGLVLQSAIPDTHFNSATGVWALMLWPLVRTKI